MTVNFNTFYKVSVIYKNKKVMKKTVMEFIKTLLQQRYDDL